MKISSKTVTLAFITGLLVSLALPFSAFAQVKMDPTLKPEFAPSFTVDSKNPAQGAVAILQIIAGSLIFAAGPLAVLMIAFGGLRYVTSHGEQNQMDGAKKTITYAVIGLLVIIVSYAIVTNIITIISATGTSAPSEATTPKP